MVLQAEVRVAELAGEGVGCQRAVACGWETVGVVIINRIVYGCASRICQQPRGAQVIGVEIRRCALGALGDDLVAIFSSDGSLHKNPLPAIQSRQDFRWKIKETQRTFPSTVSESRMEFSEGTDTLLNAFQLSWVPLSLSLTIFSKSRKDCSLGINPKQVGRHIFPENSMNESRISGHIRE